MTPKLGQYFGTDKGLLVVRAPATPGMRLDEGDVILSIDGRTPENPRHAFRILGSYEPDEKVKVDVLRQRKRTDPRRCRCRDIVHGGRQTRSARASAA